MCECTHVQNHASINKSRHMNLWDIRQLSNPEIVHFGNVTGYRAAVSVKKELLLRHFSRILSIDTVSKIMEQLF